MAFSMVLKEKPYDEGITLEEITEMAKQIDSANGYYVIDIQGECGSAAMGLIDPAFAALLSYDYEGSGLNDFISSILDDTEKESPKHIYFFKENAIYLDR